MKKFLTALLVLTVLSTVLLAAPNPGRSFGPGANVGPQRPEGPAFVAPFKEQLKERIMLKDREQIWQRMKETIKEESKETFKAMNMTKEQARQILQIVNETKEKLNAIQKEFKELQEKAGTMTLNEYRTAIQQLNQKRVEIMMEARQKIGDVITVDQMRAAVKNLYRERLRTRLQPKIDFFNENVLEALEEYAK